MPLVPGVPLANATGARLEHFKTHELWAWRWQLLALNFESLVTRDRNPRLRRNQTRICMKPRRHPPGIMLLAALAGFMAGSNFSRAKCRALGPPSSENQMFRCPVLSALAGLSLVPSPGTSFVVGSCSFLACQPIGASMCSCEITVQSSSRNLTRASNARSGWRRRPKCSCRILRLPADPMPPGRKQGRRRPVQIR